VYRVLDSGTNGVALPGGGPLVYPITSLLWQDALPQGDRFTFLHCWPGRRFPACCSVFWLSVWLPW